MTTDCTTWPYLRCAWSALSVLPGTILWIWLAWLGQREKDK